MAVAGKTSDQMYQHFKKFCQILLSNLVGPLCSFFHLILKYKEKGSKSI